MFNSSYTYICLGKTILPPLSSSKGLICTLHYKFSTENGTSYLIYVRCYTNSLYLVEFFLRADRNCNNDTKYGKIINKGKASKIITTCFMVMIEILHKNPLASFAFIGAPTTVDGSTVEPKFK